VAVMRALSCSAMSMSACRVCQCSTQGLGCVETKPPAA
jgi:hypothetical protein